MYHHSSYLAIALELLRPRLSQGLRFQDMDSRCRQDVSGGTIDDSGDGFQLLRPVFVYIERDAFHRQIGGRNVKIGIGGKHYASPNAI